MKTINRLSNHQKYYLANALTLFLTLLLTLFTFSACSSNNNKSVPDNLAIDSVGECTYSMPYASTTYVVHNRYDEESHLDYVTIVTKSEGTYGYGISTCNAIFQYNRASDLWSPFAIEEWTEPKYTFNSNLIGSYDVGPKDEYDKISSCHIEIVSVTEKSIQLNYDISVDIDLAFSIFEDLHVDKSGTETLTNGEFYISSREDYPHISLSIDLPEGYVLHNFYIDGESVDTFYLDLEIDLNSGIKFAEVVGTATRSK